MMSSPLLVRSYDILTKPATWEDNYY